MEENEEPDNSLGSFIRAQRELASLSVRELSKMAEISNAYLSQIERDLHEPSLRVLRNVGDALGLSPETMLARAGLLVDQDQDSASAEFLADLPTVEAAILADPHLADDKKQALIVVYRSYLPE